MVREITIIMDIDEATHTGDVLSSIKEDGKPKDEWSIAQLVSTAFALEKVASRLTERALDQMKEEAGE